LKCIRTRTTGLTEEGMTQENSAPQERERRFLEAEVKAQELRISNQVDSQDQDLKAILSNKKVSNNSIFNNTYNSDQELLI
jgi:hypothetical protein